MEGKIMIHALNVTGVRDKELSDMMIESLKLNCHNLGDIVIKWGDDIPWGNGAGWEASMIKIDFLRSMKLEDSDFVLCVDSDILFCSPDVFDYVTSDYGIIGIYGDYHPRVRTLIGDLVHMSGCCMFIRGDIVKKITEMSKFDLEQIRKEFKRFVLCENEDVVLSYLCQKFGAYPFMLPQELYNGNLERDLVEDTLKSFYHLNYSPAEFLGEKITGKWDIPKVLKAWQ